MTVVRGTVTALAVALLVASGAWAAPTSAAGGSAHGTVTATAVDGVHTVTATTLNETVENTTETIDDGTTNTTETVDDETTETLDGGTTTNVTDDGTTVTVDAGVDGGTASGSVEAGADDEPTVDATLNGSVAATSGNAELAVDDSGGTASATVDGGDTLAVTADATADGETRLLRATTASDATAAGTSTPSGTTEGNASAGVGGDSDGPDSGSGSDVPTAAAGAALAGLGAAAVTLLARRSATLLALVPDAAATASRLPSPLARLWRTGRGWLPRLLAAVGYSRYDDSDPLTHETRAELYDLIDASPGTYLSELSDRADVPTSTVRHHLDVLVREGVVTTANVRGKRRYFSLDADEALAAALSDDASAAVIDCLAETGPASVSAIAEELERDVSTVSHHLDRLAEDGLVEREREGRSVYSELTPEVANALGGDGSGRQPKRA